MARTIDTSASKRAPRLAIVPRALFVLVAIWVFLCAISVLKEGAAELAPVLRGSAIIDSAASTLGFGWLAAMLVMSGSPIAVSALALVDGGVIDRIGGITMLTGSRLGASFVVLVVAFVYAMRGERTGDARRASLSIGVMSLIATGIVYIPAVAIAIIVIRSEVMRDALPSGKMTPPDVIHAITEPVASLVARTVPDSLQFLVGLALLLMAVRLIERALPGAADTARLDEHQDWRSRKWAMFAVGSLVALVTMSVSVALTVLVPAVAKGHFRRRQVLPYIMGANITTLGDTLLTAIIIGNPAGIEIVLVELMVTTAITVLLLALCYRQLADLVARLTDWFIATKYRLVLFVAVLFCTPIALIAVP